MRKFFGFGSPTPPPPSPPSRPPAPPSKATGTPAAKAETAPAPASSLVGCWQNASGASDGSESTEFHRDGSVTEKVAGGETIRGRYRLADDKLSIDLEGLDEPLAFTAQVRGATLEMTDADGQRSTYRRA